METVRFPAVIRISRETWEIIGVEYADAEPGQLLAWGERLLRALETTQEARRTREAREAAEREGEDHV